MPDIRRLLALVLATGMVLTACGGDDATGSGAAASETEPTVVATTTILGDLVERLAGDQVDVVTIMPPGASPHTFQASAQQAATMASADALVVNGAGFEEGLRSVVDNAASGGVPVHEAIEPVEPLPAGGEPDEGEPADEDDHGQTEDDHGHADEAEHGHAEDDHGHADEAEHGHVDEEHGHEGDAGHGDEAEADHDHGHDHGDVDPHFFTDPLRTIQAVRGISTFLAEALPGVDQDALRRSTDDLVGELEALHAEIGAVLADVPPEQRILVTDHRVFDHFADRYGFEVVGTVVPSGSTAEGVSGGALAELAEVVRRTGVPAIFVSDADAAEVADTLAAEVGDVEVVPLFAESLGGPGSGAETYRDMMLTNARRIAEALTRAAD